MPPTGAPLRIGIVGLGSAARMMLPAIKANPRVQLVAVTTRNPQTRQAFAQAAGARPCPDLESLLALQDLDAVFIATPTPVHAQQVRLAAAHGKHVIVEKPMAANLAEAAGMIEAAERHGVKVIVGHSRSFDSPIRKMREVIAGGSLGRVRMIQSMVFTDWIYRPRLPEELDPELGGGVIFRQGAHQFDVIRLLGGGMLTSVRASVFDFDRSRSAIGAYAAFLTFQDAGAATAVYNGYGAFTTSELTHGIGERGFLEQPEAIGTARRGYLERGQGDEQQLKLKRAAGADRGEPPHSPNFGLSLASCEQGDIRQSPDGLYVYSAKGREEIRVPSQRSAYSAVLNELLGALDRNEQPLHDGRWGMANLEVCEAALRSARTGLEQKLVHQVPVRD